ncbi:hypothetical protein Holit_03284 [Hollandina sp. SP2]
MGKQFRAGDSPPVFLGDPEQGYLGYEYGDTQESEVAEKIQGLQFDVVADFITFGPRLGLLVLSR